jgi:uncharacterized protein
MSVLYVVLAVLAAVATLIILIAAGSARTIIQPGRNPAWSDPMKDQALPYEDVTFPSQDGVRLDGWFIPAGTPAPAPTIVMLHGWPWCRMGTRASSRLNDLPGSKPVPLLPLARAYHDAGYNVLMYDQSSFGTSGSRGVLTHGWLEARDLLGALDFLGSRPEVDGTRIAAIGFSLGGSALTFALPHTTRIRAAIAIQPTTPDVFSPRYGRSMFGPLAAVVYPVSELFFRIAGGPRLHYVQPVLAAAGTRDTPILFVQGTGDTWGSVADVQRMADASPNGSILLPETGHRFDGYNYMVERPEISLAFFNEHLGVARRQEVADSAALGGVAKGTTAAGAVAPIAVASGTVAAG